MNFWRAAEIQEWRINSLKTRALAASHGCRALRFRRKGKFSFTWEIAMCKGTGWFGLPLGPLAFGADNLKVFGRCAADIIWAEERDILGAIFDAPPGSILKFFGDPCTELDGGVFFPDSLGGGTDDGSSNALILEEKILRNCLRPYFPRLTRCSTSRLEL